MTEFSISAALLKECFKTSAACVEDLRKLYLEESKRSSGGRINLDEFSRKINLYDPDKEAAYEAVINSASIVQSGKDLHDELSAIGPHIPYWLRVYIACRRIASEMSLDEVFGFISVAIESINAEGNRRQGDVYAVLTNKSKPNTVIKFGTFQQAGKNTDIRTFARIYNKLAGYIVDNSLPMASYWSVRVNAANETVDENEEIERPHDDSWLELVLGKNQEGIHDRLVTVKLPGDPLSRDDHETIRKLVKYWCHGGTNEGLDRNANDQIKAYTKKIKESFATSPTQFDGLMCTSLFWAPSKEEDGAIPSIYWAFSEELDPEQIRTIQALTQILLSGVAPIARYTLIDKRRQQELERSERMLKLLQEPLTKLSEALEATQEHTQELRAVLYDPRHVIFSAAPRVMKYFEDRTTVKNGQVQWKTSHGFLQEDDARTLKLTLAAIICEIFGIMEPEPRNEGELVYRAEAALSGSEPAFEELQKICSDILGGEVFNGDDAQLKTCRQHACEHFKEILHRPYKYKESQYPFEPLFLALFSIADKPPKVRVDYNSSITEFNSLQECMQWDCLRPGGGGRYGANLFQPSLVPPVPLYSHWLALLLGVIVYAKSRSAQLRTVFITSWPEKMEVALEFDKNILPEGVNFDLVCSEMEKWLNSREYAFHTKGNLFKPFTDFVWRIGRIDNNNNPDKPSLRFERNGNHFYLYHPELQTTLEMCDKTFRYSCHKELSGAVASPAALGSGTPTGVGQSSRHQLSVASKEEIQVEVSQSSVHQQYTVLLYFNYRDNATVINRFFESNQFGGKQFERIKTFPDLMNNKFKKYDGEEINFKGADRLLCLVHDATYVSWEQLCRDFPNRIDVIHITEGGDRQAVADLGNYYSYGKVTDFQDEYLKQLIEGYLR